MGIGHAIAHSTLDHLLVQVELKIDVAARPSHVAERLRPAAQVHVPFCCWPVTTGKRVTPGTLGSSCPTMGSGDGGAVSCRLA